MRQVAQVREVLSDGRAEVCVVRRSACGGECGSCHGCDGMEEREVLVIAQNPIGAKIGERVIVESQTAATLKAAGVVYLLPFVLLFVFYFVGTQFGERIGLFAGLCGFIVAFLLARRLNHRQTRFSKLTFTLVGLEGE